MIIIVVIVVNFVVEILNKEMFDWPQNLLNYGLCHVFTAKEPFWISCLVCVDGKQ